MNRNNQADPAVLARDRFALVCQSLPTPLAWKLLDVMHRRVLVLLEAKQHARVDELTDNIFALTRELARRVRS